MFVTLSLDDVAGRREGGAELGLMTVMFVAPLVDENAGKRDRGTKLGLLPGMFVAPLVDEDADKRDGCTKLELSTELKARGDIVAVSYTHLTLPTSDLV